MVDLYFTAAFGIVYYTFLLTFSGYSYIFQWINYELSYIHVYPSWVKLKNIKQFKIQYSHKLVYLQYIRSDVICVSFHFSCFKEKCLAFTFVW